MTQPPLFWLFLNLNKCKLSNRLSNDTLTGIPNSKRLMNKERKSSFDYDIPPPREQNFQMYRPNIEPV